MASALFIAPTADVLFDGSIVVVTVGLTAILFVGLWFVLGAMRRISVDRD